MDDVILLFTVVRTKDAYGVERETRTSRQIFCKKQSVTRTEFFAGGREGLNPAFVFTVFAGDYSGETLVSYNGQSYSVYRTYQPDADYMELYVQREGGSNGKSDTNRQTEQED